MIICYIKSFNKITTLEIIIDFLIEILMTIFIFGFKRFIETLHRKVFSQEFLIENFLSYFEDILNNFNCLHFSFKNDKILYANKNTREVINQFKKKYINNEKINISRDIEKEINHNKDFELSKKEKKKTSDKIIYNSIKDYKEEENLDKQNKIILINENEVNQSKKEKKKYDQASKIKNKTIKFKLCKNNKINKKYLFFKNYYSFKRISFYRKLFKLNLHSNKNLKKKSLENKKKLNLNNKKLNNDLHLENEKLSNTKKFRKSKSNKLKYSLERENSEENQVFNLNLKEIMKKIFKNKNTQEFKIDQANDYLEEISEFNNLFEIYEFLITEKNIDKNSKIVDELKFKSQFKYNFKDKLNEEKKLISIEDNNESSSMSILKNQNGENNNILEKKNLEIENKLIIRNKTNNDYNLERNLSIIDNNNKKKNYFYI